MLRVYHDMNPSESSSNSGGSGSTSRHGRLELQVGFFVLVGLLIAGVLVVNFGRYGQGLRPRYPLTVEFPNASGLLKNSKVLLAGARIGSVTGPPRLLPGNRGVSLEVRIFENVRIPKNAAFVIGSSGLMGDRFVDIIPKATPSDECYAAGDTVVGTRQAGMDDLTREGGLLLTDLRGAVNNLNGTISAIRNDLLKPATLDRIDATLANLQDATKKFKDSSDQLGGLMGDARGAVADARTAIGGTKETLETANKAAGDLRTAIADTRRVLASARRAVDQATNGRGPVATLLNDRTVSDNLSSLISNLRRSGVLFYKDRPVPASVGAPPTEMASGERGSEERRR